MLMGPGPDVQCTHINNESKAAVYSLLLSGRLARRFRWRGGCAISRRGGVGEERSELEGRGLSVGGGSGGVTGRASSGAGVAAGVAGVEGVDAVERVTRVGDSGTAGVAGGLGGLTTTRTVRGGERRASAGRSRDLLGG